MTPSFIKIKKSNKMSDLQDKLKTALFLTFKNNGDAAFVEVNDLLKTLDVDPIEPFEIFFEHERLGQKDITIAKITTSTFPHTLIRSLRGGTIDVIEQVVDFIECQIKTKSLSLKPFD